ncbi:unnamed protein product [Bursaphelenchus xylophilus]|uniref:(pine wood nematode) hypothetical protein n=1 Tax=Bursaphelenchus xylophilus TaxID=6326 RepID=A0A1I7RVT6_BURXY|nr:unnamed protein product [Bursaphelenchus xylophilus]CAG9082156.1 unnamed protein product [Bursaphelenchus xylophilus]
MLNGWLQRAENIRQSRPGSMKSGRSGRKPHFPEVEEKLFEIYGKEEDFKNNQWLRETAKKLANEVKFDNSKGQFSERWLANFKRRYQLENEKGWRESRNSLTETESHSDTESESMCGAEIGSDWASGLKELAGELLGQPQPPIHGFYRRFPELRRKTPAAKRKRTI